MKDLLNEKLKIYRSLDPVLPEARKWLEDSNLWMLLYTVLCQRGVRIEKKTLVEILSGQILENVHIDLYGFCFRLRDVYKDMISAVEMQATLNTKMLDGWYQDLLEPDGPVHRRDNAVVYDIGFIPCHFSEITERMDRLFKSMAGIEDGALKAAELQMGIINIYAYGQESITMALLAAAYALLEAGIPLASYPVSEDEYRRLISACINEGDEEPFCSMHYRSLVNRLETVIQVYQEAAQTAGS
ncbi:MAG: hypothetical protein IK035_08645 [Firmicutes bacterium]|nr:hypothetical protein [Bacillota bacterium]